MRKMRKIGAAALALVMILALTPALANAAGVRTVESGVTGVKKLLPWETALLLSSEKAVDPGKLYEREPDLEAPFEDAGAISAEHSDAALARLNHIRALAGLPAVKTDGQYTELSQAGAYVDALNGQLSHYPVQPAGLGDSLYALGARGAGESNMAWTSRKTDLKYSVDMWAEDSDASNIDRLGHRRWVLNPTMDRTGFGYCAAGGSYSAMYSFSRNGPKQDYDFIGWPASGYFPAGEGFFTAVTAWSVTLNPDKYARPGKSDVKVTLRRESDGKTWEFSGSDYDPGGDGDYFNVETSNYGVNNAIIFRPSGLESLEGRYTVTVSGVKTTAGAAADFRYTVEFFDLEKTVAEYTAPEFTDLTQDWMLEPVRFVYSHGKVMAGTGDRQFSPQNAVDLGTALTVMARLSGVDTAVSDGDWARPGMEWGRSRGLTESTTATDPMTREELVYMLWVVAGGPAGDETVLGDFTDGTQVSEKYREALAWAVTADILRGGENKNLTPTSDTTRVQLAAFVQRAFEGGYPG